MTYILPQCGCKIGATIRPRHHQTFGDTSRFEKVAWFEHVCEMHKQSLKDEYVNDARLEVNSFEW